jgi:hypothetical protein
MHRQMSTNVTRCLQDAFCGSVNTCTTTCTATPTFTLYCRSRSLVDYVFATHVRSHLQCTDCGKVTHEVRSHPEFFQVMHTAMLSMLSKCDLGHAGMCEVTHL